MKSYYRFNNSIAIPILYVIGLLHWYLFLNYNSPTFTSGDWHVGHQLFDVFKQALITGKIPFHATLYATGSPESTLYGSIRFLGMPWIVMPPLLFLLKFFSIPVFYTCQFWLYYTISFIVVLKWTKKLNLSTSASVFLLILFNFYGALVSKASAGQTIWGYMLIPWFLWIIYKFIENDKPSRSKSLMIMLEFSFLLFFLLLSGDMHNFYQFVLVGFCVLIFYPNRILSFVSGTLIGIVLSAWYFVPNILFSAYTSSVLLPVGHWRRRGILGYGFQNGDSGVPLLEYSRDMPEITKILIHSINILNHLWESLTHSFNPSHENVWEYNLYISYLGVVLIIGSLIALFIRYKPLSMKDLIRYKPLSMKDLIRYKPLSMKDLMLRVKDLMLRVKDLMEPYRLLGGAIIVILLAIGSSNYKLVKFFQSIYPFNPIDAIPSRLMLYPFGMVLLISSLGFDSMFKIFPEKIRPFLKWILLFLLLMLLMQHSYKWWLIQANAIMIDQFQGEFKTTIYDNIDDGFYKAIVIISYLSSIITVSCGGFFYLWLKRHENNKLLPELNGS